MFNEFLTALLKKTLIFLKENPGFSERTQETRKKHLEDLSVPSSFKNYLEQISENHFVEDISIIIKFIRQPKDKSIKESKFFKSFVEFLTAELAKKIDFLDSHYYLLKATERTDFVEKLLKGESLLATTLRNILINNTYQQLAENINYLATTVANSDFIVVQSPREISHELKREVREEILKENPLCLPVFQINKKIIGGIRIFENGTTKDHSWLSRVLKFTSLTSA